MATGGRCSLWPPRGLSRTFTLREAAALLDLVPTNAPPDGDTLPERARALVAALAAARSHRQSAADDDVRDPIGHPVAVHEEVGEVIAQALLPILRRIADVQ